MRKIFSFLLGMTVSLLCAFPGNSYAQGDGSSNSEAAAVQRLLGIHGKNGTSFPLRNQTNVYSDEAESKSLASDKDGIPTICGSLLFTYDWVASQNREYGIYSFKASSPITYQPVAINDNLFALGGGCYHDGRYSLVSFYDTMGAIIASYYEFDTETWEMVKHYNNVGAGSIAVDMAYDPTSHNIYGCFLNDTRDGYVFGLLDTDTGVRIAISNLRSPLFALACNSQGQVYGVDGYGQFVKIDKNTGATTIIGATGLVPYNSQSAAIDPMTDRFYWAACTQSVQGLYEVDIQTGKASLISKFDNGEEWGGLYIAPPAAADGAPAAVSNLTVTYDPLSTANAIVNFTMPSTTFGEEELSGSLEYIITLNGNEVDMGTAQAGENVETTVYNTTVGTAVIGVRVRNAAGLSPNVRTSLYLGHDAPAAVNNLSIAVTEGGNVISWDAPTASVHGGYCDLNEVTYRIIRQPENRVIANRLKETTFTDVVNPLVLSEYSYDVIPFAGSLQGESTRTEKVLVGDSFEVPYYENFDNPTDFGLFTVFDCNNDGRSWIRQDDGTAQSYYSMTQNMDDWLISPPIHLTTDQLYKFSMSAKVMNGFPERMEVKIGRGRTPEDMTITVLPAAEYHDAAYQTFANRFGIDEEGDWYIGLHCISDPESYRMNIDWIKLEADLLTTAPAAPSDFTVTAGEKGALEATILLKAPTTAINGTALESVQQVKVYRGQKLVKSFNNPQPGEELTFKEENLPNGMAEYRAEALNAYGPGLDATAKGFVGIDIPSTPTDVKLELIDDVPTITWSAPVIGENGGYIDVDNLEFYVQRGTDEVLVAMNVKGNSSTDKYYTIPEEQEELYYFVYAASPTGIGIGQATNILVVGPAYSLPFKESFTNGYLEHSLWGIVDTPYTGTWGIVNTGTMPMCEASDADNGLLEFQTAGINDESFLYSGKIDIADTENVKLNFDYYYYPQQTDVLQVMVSSNGVDWTTVDVVDFCTLHGEAEWRTETVELAEAIKSMEDTGYLQVGFRAVSIDGIWHMHMDNIVVYDETTGITDVTDKTEKNMYFYDLSGRRVTSTKAPIVITSDGRKFINK